MKWLLRVVTEFKNGIGREGAGEGLKNNNRKNGTEFLL